MQIHLVALNGRYTHSCLALFYVRGELERHLPQSGVRLHQFTINDPYYETLLRLSAAGPDVLFFSVYIWNSGMVGRLVRDLVRVLPHTDIVLGGPQAPFMEDMPEQCTVVRGEIEGVGASFYHDLAAGNLKRAYTAAAGSAFRMPYRPEDFSGELRDRHIYYESSRGCPFSCAYCLSSVEHGVRHRDTAEVKAELAALLRHEPKIVRFVDRTFNANRARALELWQFLAGQPGRTVFHFEIAPDRFDQAMLDFLQTVPAGRFQFEIGVQSTNPETLRAVNRLIDTEQAAANIAALLRSDNIHLHVDLILGLPFETAATFRRSFNDVFRLQPHYIQMGLLKVLPATPISRAVSEFGLVHCQAPPYEILANRWLDHQTVSRLHRFGQCVEAFHNNRFFKSVFQYVRNRGEEPYAFFEALYEHCRRRDFFRRAHTQELMNRMLYGFAGTRPDAALLRELLSHEWLRSGHRFLPSCFDGAALTAAKNYLWKQLPQNLEPYFTYKSRSEFFKKAVFAPCSKELLDETGLDSGGQDGFVCFLPEQEAGVLAGRKRAVFIV